MSEIHLVYSWPFCLNAIIDYFVIIETEQIQSKDNKQSDRFGDFHSIS